MEKREPFLSIVVPAYNVEEFIRECIESILNQSFLDYELILVDDGAKDNTGKICDSYAQKDSRIVVVHKENGGLVSARKAGISVARGQYVACVDGDDWIAPEMMEVLCKAAKTENADIAMADLIVSRKDEEEVLSQVIAAGNYDKKTLREKVYPVMLCAGDYFSFGLQPSVCGNVFRRDLLLRNQMLVSNKISLGEDAACFYPAILEAEKVVYIKEGYYYYRMRESSITHSVKKAIYTDAVFALIERLYNCFFEYKDEWLVLERQLWLYASYMFDNMITPYLGGKALFLNNDLKKEFSIIRSNSLGQRMLEYCTGVETSSRNKRILSVIKNDSLYSRVNLYLFWKYEKLGKNSKRK